MHMQTGNNLLGYQLGAINTLEETRLSSRYITNRIGLVKLIPQIHFGILPYSGAMPNWQQRLVSRNLLRAGASAWTILSVPSCKIASWRHAIDSVVHT